jgi:hypothetical protein
VKADKGVIASGSSVKEVMEVAKRKGIAFSNELTTSLNILGRESFFDRFLITCDERQKKLILESSD